MDDFTISLSEDTVYEYKETRPVAAKKTHYPLNGPYLTGAGRELLSFSPGDLAKYSLFEDVRVFYLCIWGKAVDNQDDREAWADAIRIEVLRRLMGQHYHWYIGAIGWYSNPDGSIDYQPLEEYLQQQALSPESLQSISVRSFPERSGKMVSGEWVWTESPGRRTFFEIPLAFLENVAATIWSSASPGNSIEGYLLPPHSLNVLDKWGDAPLDEKLFRQVIDACPVLFSTFPEENIHFVFFTNKWTIGDMQTMLDVPSLQAMAEHLKAQLES